MHSFFVIALSTLPIERSHWLELTCLHTCFAFFFFPSLLVSVTWLAIHPNKQNRLSVASLAFLSSLFLTFTFLCTINSLLCHACMWQLQLSKLLFFALHDDDDDDDWVWGQWEKEQIDPYLILFFLTTCKYFASWNIYSLSCFLTWYCWYIVCLYSLTRQHAPSRISYNSSIKCEAMCLSLFLCLSLRPSNRLLYYFSHALSTTFLCPVLLTIYGSLLYFFFQSPWCLFSSFTVTWNNRFTLVRDTATLFALISSAFLSQSFLFLVSHFLFAYVLHTVRLFACLFVSLSNNYIHQRC